MRGEHVACRGENFIQDFGRKCARRDSLGGLHLDGRIILKLILGELDERAWTAFVRLRIG